MKRQIVVSGLTLMLAAVFNSGGAAADPESSVESKFLSNVRQVTSGMTRAGEGYFSPDGRTIIYQAVPVEYPFYQIYSQPLAGGTPKLLSTGRGRTTCSNFSPDGKKILFASSHLDPQLDKTESDARRQQAEDQKAGVRRRYQWDFDPHTDIFEADLDGKNLRQLTTTFGYDAEGAYSRDGKLIAYCHDSGADPNSPPSADKPNNPDIYVMNSDGSQSRRLTTAPGYDGGPFISPDGQWVIFRSDRKKAEYLQIYAIGIDGKNEVALTDTNGVNWGPYWHPSEPYIIWSGADHSDRNARPNYDLWLAKYEVKDDKLALGPVQRVTDFAGGDVLPVFSPDGKQLLWTSTRTPDHASQLYLADFHLPK